MTHQAVYLIANTAFGTDVDVRSSAKFFLPSKISRLVALAYPPEEVLKDFDATEEFISYPNLTSVVIEDSNECAEVVSVQSHTDSSRFYSSSLMI